MAMRKQESKPFVQCNELLRFLLPLFTDKLGNRIEDHPLYWIVPSHDQGCALAASYGLGIAHTASSGFTETEHRKNCRLTKLNPNTTSNLNLNLSH